MSKCATPVLSLNERQSDHGINIKSDGIDATNQNHHRLMIIAYGQLITIWRIGIYRRHACVMYSVNIINKIKKEKKNTNESYLS